MKITGEGGEPKLALMGYDEARSRKVIAQHRFLSPRPQPQPSPAEPRRIKPPDSVDSVLELQWAEDAEPDL